MYNTFVDKYKLSIVYPIHHYQKIFNEGISHIIYAKLINDYNTHLK